MNSPSQELAQHIVDKLAAEKIILAADTQELLARLAEGKMRPEDWKLAVEKAIDQEARA